jgi:L-amino acid N-acyltransferase YncA
MIIRPAQADDAQAICDIWNPLIKDTAVTFTDEIKTVQSISDLIKTRDGAFFVAEKDGAIGGFTSYSAFRGGPGYWRSKEISINLAPNARRQGMGGALLKWLETHARQQNVHSLIAAISGENPSAQSFHQKLRYQHIATLPEVGFKFGRYMDLILMQKILPPLGDMP